MLRGDDVVDLQQQLNALGFDAGRERRHLRPQHRRGAARVPAQRRRRAATASAGRRASPPSTGCPASPAARWPRCGRGKRCGTARCRLAGRRVYLAVEPGLDALGEVGGQGPDGARRRRAGRRAAARTTPSSPAEANRYAADLFLGPAVRRHPRPLLLRLLRLPRLPIRGGLPRGPVHHRGAGGRTRLPAGGAERPGLRRPAGDPDAGRRLPAGPGRRRRRGPPARRPGRATPAGPSSTACGGASKSLSMTELGGSRAGAWPGCRPAGASGRHRGASPATTNEPAGATAGVRRPEARDSSRPLGGQRDRRRALLAVRAARSPPAGPRAGGTRRRTRR